MVLFSFSHLLNSFHFLSALLSSSQLPSPILNSSHLHSQHALLASSYLPLLNSSRLFTSFRLFFFSPLELFGCFHFCSFCALLLPVFSCKFSLLAGALSFCNGFAQVCSILRFRLSVERSHVLRCGHHVETALSLPLHMIQVPFVLPPFFSRVTSPHKTAELLRRLRAQICTMFEKMFIKNSVN